LSKILNDDTGADEFKLRIWVQIIVTYYIPVWDHYVAWYKFFLEWNLEWMRQSG
jgi:hypothetical protein